MSIDVQSREVPWVPLSSHMAFDHQSSILNKGSRVLVMSDIVSQHLGGASLKSSGLWVVSMALGGNIAYKPFLCLAQLTLI